MGKKILRHIKENKKKYGILWIIGVILTLYLNQPVYKPYATISGCTSITSSGEYYLDSDIINSGTSNCINITANNVTLDCQNHKIDGDDSAAHGIYVSRSSEQITNITIKNCIVTDWDSANIYFKNAGGNALQNIIANSSPDYGIYLSFSDSNTFQSIAANSNSKDGIYLEYSESNIFQNVTANSNSNSGIYFWYADPNKFKNITVNNNKYGIYLYWIFSLTFKSITANYNDYGIYFWYGGSNTVQNAVANYNNYDGIYLRASDSNSFRNITINSNSQYGICLNGSSDSNTLRNITANSNNYYGIYLRDSDSNTIVNSTIQNNSEYGIYISSSQSNKIYNNLFNNSANFYISGTGTNYWNTSKTSGTNIIGESYLGGNYWTNPAGEDYSDRCEDSNGDGLCDVPYNLATNNIDYLPLSYNTTAYIYAWNGTNYTELPKHIKFICSYIESNCEPYYQNLTQPAIKVTNRKALTSLQLKLPHDKSIIFDGEDDYIKIPDSGNLVFSDELTITAWIKPHLCKDIDDKAGNIIGRMNNEFRFRLNTDCQFWFLIANQSNS
ncbi:MAG: hypothetical protein DRP72_02980, partial [Candidatus Omnitrophota bacterium]